MLSSGSNVANDISFPVVAPAAKDLIEHSFNKGNNLGYNSKEEEDMAPKQRVLGKKKPTGDKPAKQALDPVLALPNPTEAQSNISSSQQASKRKGKQPAKGPSHQKKGKGAGSLADPLRIIGTPELWTPKFAIVCGGARKNI